MRICSSSAFVQPANVPLLFLRIHEKDGKIKLVEELLQAEILKVASKEKTVQVSISAIPAFLSVSVTDYHLFVTAWHSIVMNL